MEGIKHDSGKVRWDLVPFRQLEEIAKVLTFGAIKYPANSWQGVEKERYQAALMRHFVDYMEGEQVDSESGLQHLSHLACNAMFLLWMEANESKD